MSETEVEIRQAGAADFAVVAEMVGALSAHHGDTATLDVAGLKEFAEDGWVTVLVAVSDGGILGYAAYFRQPSLHDARRILNLHNLFVRPEARGAGIGHALVAAVEASAREQGCGWLALGATADNTAAQGFYEGLGFERRTDRNIVRYARAVPPS